MCTVYAVYICVCVCVSVVIVVTVCECSCSCICEFCSSALSCQLHVSATFRFRLFASSCCCCCCIHCCCCCCCCFCFVVDGIWQHDEAAAGAERMLMLMPGLEQSTTNQVGCCCRCPLPKDFTCTSHTHTRRETDKDTPGHTQIQNGRRLAQVLGLCNLYLSLSLSGCLSVPVARSA